MELLLGCGRDRQKRIYPEWCPPDWTHLVTADIDPHCGADVVVDFDRDPLPFRDDTFDEVHVYEVMEHLGTQGDYRAFFRHFGEIYRVLKHGGIVVGTTPRWDAMWAWCDPGHRRIVSPATLWFLDQDVYNRPGDTIRTDYRWLWKGDLKLVWHEDLGDSSAWILQAHKAGASTSSATETPAPPKD